MERYVFDVSKEEAEINFGIKSSYDSMFNPSFNVYPGTQIPIILKDGNAEITLAKWGITDPKNADKRIVSMQVEAVLSDTKKQKMIQKQPCIIPLSGFYKWKETVQDPLPFYIRRLTYSVLAAAGYYEKVKDEHGNAKYKFTVLTTPANVLLLPLDDRMPYLLEKKNYESWLSGEVEKCLNNALKSTELIPDLALYRVSDLVNDPKNNNRDLIQPIPKLRDED